MRLIITQLNDGRLTIFDTQTGITYTLSPPASSGFLMTALASSSSQIVPFSGKQAISAAAQLAYIFPAAHPYISGWLITAKEFNAEKGNPIAKFIESLLPLKKEQNND